MPIKLNEREYRRIDVTNLEARTDGDNQKIVEGYATTFDQEYPLWDSGDYRVVESIDRNAFSETDMSDVIMQYDHEGRVFARVKNNTLQLTVDNHGLKIRADLGGTELGRQLYEEIKGGYTDKMSFGFSVSKDERTEERDQENNKITIHRKITGIKKLYDVSAVSIPANDTTEISARSCGEGFIDAARREAAAIVERQRKIKRIKILMEVGNNENH
jgi:HK97 family phage prohead protease